MLICWKNCFGTFLLYQYMGQYLLVQIQTKTLVNSAFANSMKDSFCRLMIANPQAGGEGISLHRVCHYAIYLDRTFNAAHYLQSVDRIHRLGLPNSVNTFIEIIIAKNTIDEVVLKRLNIKTKSMSKVLDDPGLLKLAYDPEELEDNSLGLDKEDINSISEHLLNPND